MIRRSRIDDIKPPVDDHPVGAVTILDAEGKVVRVIPAAEFRRDATGAPRPDARIWRRGKKSA